MIKATDNYLMEQVRNGNVEKPASVGTYSVSKGYTKKTMSDLLGVQKDK